jgi:CelD/BcsL family acetyltransferase involved in cellulose biosynthesis
VGPSPRDATVDRSVVAGQTASPARARVGAPRADAAFSTAAPADSDLYGEWGELAEGVAESPFAHPGWVATWADAFAGRRLSVLGVRRDGRLVGIVPFLARRTGIVSPTNWHTPRFGLVAVDAQAREELAAGLVGRARHRLDISFLDARSDDLRAVRDAAESAGRKVVVRPIQRSLYVDVDGDWDGYESQIGSKPLRELRRRRRRLDDEGRVTVDFANPDHERLDALLAEGFAVEGSGWKDEQGTAIVSKPETHGFYTDIARWAAERGWLTLAFLRVEGRAVAFDLCLECGGRTYVLKGGYDPAFRAFAPRTILLHDSLERAFARGARSYEFLGADEDYKRRWATGAHEYARLQAFPRTATGLAGYAAWTAGRSAGKRALALRDRARRPSR